MYTRRWKTKEDSVKALPFAVWLQRLFHYERRELHEALREVISPRFW